MATVRVLTEDEVRDGYTDNIRLLSFSGTYVSRTLFFGKGRGEHDPKPN